MYVNTKTMLMCDLMGPKLRLLFEGGFYSSAAFIQDFTVHLFSLFPSFPRKGDVVYSVCRRIVPLRIVSLSSIITRARCKEISLLSCPARDSCVAAGEHNTDNIQHNVVRLLQMCAYPCTVAFQGEPKVILFTHIVKLVFRRL